MYSQSPRTFSNCLRAWQKLLLIVALFTAFGTSLHADVNVLIIGSQKDSSVYQTFVYADNSEWPYQPVVARNLESWFRWPYPADVETTTRWPNLRGKRARSGPLHLLQHDSRNFGLVFSLN